MIAWRCCRPSLKAGFSLTPTLFMKRSGTGKTAEAYSRTGRRQNSSQQGHKDRKEILFREFLNWLTLPPRKSRKAAKAQRNKRRTAFEQKATKDFYFSSVAPCLGYPR